MELYANRGLHFIPVNLEGIKFAPPPQLQRWKSRNFGPRTVDRDSPKNPDPSGPEAARIDGMVISDLF